MPDRYFQHTFPNGLTLLGEKMPGDAVGGDDAAAAGRRQPPTRWTAPGRPPSCPTWSSAGPGSATAGRSPTTSTAWACSAPAASASTTRRFGCAALARQGDGRAWRRYADIVRRPHLPEAGFEAARDLALQALAGIDDEPRQKLMIKLREWHFPIALRPQLDGRRRSTWKS